MKQQEKGRGKLDIRVLFTLAAIAEILGTLLIATLLTALLENLLHEAILKYIHWCGCFSSARRLG